MRHIYLRPMAFCLALSIWVVPAAQAQWAVVDAPAIVQLLQQVATMEEDLAVAKNQLQSAQQAYAAMTGDRGMARLLSGTNRNYLPTNWSQVDASIVGHGAGAYGALANDIQSNTAANSVLAPPLVSAMPSADRGEIVAARQAVALQQAISREALANSSTRFSALQSLITAIPGAADQKGALDLQARISAEVGMLSNEQIKLQALYQAALAQSASLEQRNREYIIGAHGRFESRFQPTP